MKLKFQENQRIFSYSVSLASNNDNTHVLKGEETIIKIRKCSHNTDEDELLKGINVMSVLNKVNKSHKNKYNHIYNKCNTINYACKTNPFILN